MGIGACGKSLCCTTFLSEFQLVTIEHAKIQQLTGNLSKLSGNCGRLKCCLLYEYESYVTAFEKYPQPNSIIESKEGNLRVTKVDIFRETTFVQNVKSGKFSSLEGPEVLELVKSGKVKFKKSDNNYHNHDKDNS